MQHGQKYLFLSVVLIGVLVNTVSADIHSDSTRNAAVLGPRTEAVHIKEYAKVVYVSSGNGSDHNGNGTREKPWKTIGKALAELKDAGPEMRYGVCVAEGVYDQQTIEMKACIDLFGGFSKANWERDIYTFPSILDGNRVRRVVIGADNARIDGFTITNGLSRSHGGGLLCDGTSPQVTNNFITGNFVLEPENFNNSRIHQEGYIGGGIACLYDAVPLIRNNVFFRNRTSIGMGAGIAFYGWVRHKGGPPMEVRGNRLSGGLRARVENNVLIQNDAGVNDVHRTRSSSGGGIACAYEARPVIRNNLIAGNKARGNSDAGGIYCEYFSDPDIIGNWIVGNEGDDDGGGIYTMKLGHPLIKGNVIAGNRTTGGGIGGIRLSKEGRARILDNIIVQNPGGGVMCVDAFMELVHNIIADNPAGAGLTYLTHYSYMQSSTLRENTFRNNENGAILIREESLLRPEMNENHLIEDTVPDLFVEDAIELSIQSLSFDSDRYMTEIRLDRSPGDHHLLIGRVLNIGSMWSIVRAQEGDRLFVWGDLTGDSGHQPLLRIMRTYRPKQ